MAADKDTFRIVTPECRWLYPHFFEKRQPTVNGRPKGDPRYEVTLVFEPDTIEDLKAKALEAARAKWPGRDLKERPVKFPFKLGDKLNEKRRAAGKAPRPGIGGKVVLQATSTFPVQVVDNQGNPILDASRVYSGCYGVVEITFAPYDGNGDNIPDCVTTYVNMAMKTRDGDRIGGRDAKTVFAGVIGKRTQEDPTAGLDDELRL